MISSEQLWCLLWTPSVWQSLIQILTAIHQIQDTSLGRYLAEQDFISALGYSSTINSIATCSSSPGNPGCQKVGNLKGTAQLVEATASWIFLHSGKRERKSPRLCRVNLWIGISLEWTWKIMSPLCRATPKGEQAPSFKFLSLPFVNPSELLMSLHSSWPSNPGLKTSDSSNDRACQQSQTASCHISKFDVQLLRNKKRIMEQVGKNAKANHLNPWQTCLYHFPALLHGASAWLQANTYARRIHVA